MFIKKNNESRGNGSKIKLAAALFCLIAAMIFTVQSVFAFFSDIIVGDENIVAGTLDIAENSVLYFINGSGTPATREELDTINPGDYVTVQIDMENRGSKSAWLLMDFELNGAAAAELDTVFTVYEGVGTGGNILSGTPDLNDPDRLHFLSAGDTIIDGTVETEINSVGTSLVLTYTVEFDAAAGNRWQNQPAGIAYTVKALQYRNNPAPNWDEAVAL